MKRSKPSTTRTPKNMGFLWVEWIDPEDGAYGTTAVEVERFDSLQKAEIVTFDLYRVHGLKVKRMTWKWGELPDHEGHPW